MNTLGFKVFAVVGVLTALVLAGLVLFIISTYQRRLLESAVAQANCLGDMAERGIRQEMMGHRRGKILAMLDAFTEGDGIEKIRLLNKDGVMVMSTARDEKGRKVDMAAEMCIKCHGGQRPQDELASTERGRVFRGVDGTRRLAVITPVTNSAPCHGCHDRRKRVLGILDVVVSLGEVDASLGRLRKIAAAAGLAALACAWLGSAVVMRIFVQGPVVRLLKGTERIASGNLDAKLPVSGHDEFGRLCEAFNRMSDSLKKAATENSRWNDELEGRVREATRRLEESNRVLREADRSRTEFIRTATHQLRSPVSGMQSFLRLIMSEITGELAPKQKEMLERVDRKCSLLQATVNDLLDMASLSEEHPGSAIESIDLRGLALRVTERFQELARKKGLALEVDTGSVAAQVRASSRDLDFAVSNLVSNAVNYTSKGSVRVSVRSVSGKVSVTVADTGIGIPQADIPKLFTEFYRGENVVALRYEGTGLGLAIVKKAAEKYGGSVDIASRMGEGTVATISFPKEGA